MPTAVPISNRRLPPPRSPAAAAVDPATQTLTPVPREQPSSRSERCECVFPASAGIPLESRERCTAPAKVFLPEKLPAYWSGNRALPKPPTLPPAVPRSRPFAACPWHPALLPRACRGRVLLRSSSVLPQDLPSATIFQPPPAAGPPFAGDCASLCATSRRDVCRALGFCRSLHREIRRPRNALVRKCIRCVNFQGVLAGSQSGQRQQSLNRNLIARLLHFRRRFVELQHLLRALFHRVLKCRARLVRLVVRLQVV